jgi:undecaprenyl diphosphate synthase
MRLLRRFVLEERAELMTRGIRLTTIGDESRLPLFVRGPLGALVEATRSNSGMTLCLALSYGGRESIVRAAQRLARAAAAGRLRPGGDPRGRPQRGARHRARCRRRT